jgi:hypothetical protein
MSLFPIPPTPEQTFELMLEGVKRIRFKQNDAINVAAWLSAYLERNKNAVIDWIKAQELERIEDENNDAQIEYESEYGEHQA